MVSQLSVVSYQWSVEGNILEVPGGCVKAGLTVKHRRRGFMAVAPLCCPRYNAVERVQLMVLSRDKALAVLRELRPELERVYGERLRRVCLYGSHARDEATEDSDIDVAVVLRGPVSRAQERRRMAAAASDLSLRHDCLLTLFFLSEEEYRRPRFAVHRNIVREGVQV